MYAKGATEHFDLLWKFRTHISLYYEDNSFEARFLVLNGKGLALLEIDTASVLVILKLRIKALKPKIGLSMWNSFQTTTIYLESIMAQKTDASSSILVSLKCNAHSPAPTVGLVGTPANIVIMNHVARYAKHLVTNRETLNVVSLSNCKTLLRLTGKIMFYPFVFLCDLNLYGVDHKSAEHACESYEMRRFGCC